MRRILVSLVGASAIVLSGCYHAVVNTGLAPSGDPHVTPWAHSFIYGLVPPAVTETAQKCPGGVATVETQQSFLNGLVAAITWGIYTPMTVSYTCGKSSAERPGTKTINVGENDAQQAMQQAMELSLNIKAPVLIQF